MSDDRKRVTLRIPQDLAYSIEKLAENLQVSNNGLYTIALKTYMQSMREV